MILTPYARVIYTSTGTVQNYNVPFPYLDFDDIHIYAIDSDTRTRTEEIAVAEWVTGSRIRPASVPPSGQKFMIERVTPRDAALVDYSNGAVIEADDLDLGVLQNLYICEELIDELEWTGNEVSLLWNAYNTLRSQHFILVDAVNELRTQLEQTTVTANRAFNIACDNRAWLIPWIDKFLPFIHHYINIVVLDGGNAGTVDEIKCIVEGNVEVDYDEAIIYDGRDSKEYRGYAWTPEAIKLMYAYDYAEIALANAKKALPIACRALKAAKYLHNHEPFILDAGGVLEMMEFIS